MNVVDNKLWLGLFSLAIVGTLGNFFWTYAIAKTNVTDVMPFDFTKLIFAILIGAIFFSEKFDYWTMIGGLGIVLCNVFVSIKKLNESNIFSNFKFLFFFTFRITNKN